MVEESRGAEQIRIFYFPCYGGDLNPDEKLNQDVKTNAVGRQRPHTQEEMVWDGRSYLSSRQRSPHLIMKYFRTGLVMETETILCFP